MLPSLVAIAILVMDIFFSLSRDLARPRDQSIMWLYPREPFKVDHYPDTFGGHMSISPYSVGMRENTDQKNSKYGHFSRSVSLLGFENNFNQIYQSTFNSIEDLK